MKRLTIFFILVFSILILINFLYSQTEEILIITVEQAYLKESPENFCNTIRMLELNEEIGIIGEAENWYQVVTRYDETGWVSKSVASTYNTISTTTSEDLSQGDSSTIGTRGSGNILKAKLTLKDLTGFNYDIFVSFYNQNKEELNIDEINEINQLTEEYINNNFDNNISFRKEGDLGEFKKHNIENEDNINNITNLTHYYSDKIDSELGRKEWKEEEVYYLGLVVTMKLLDKYNINILDNSVINEYVNNIGSTLVLASSKPTYYKGYRFIVFESEEKKIFSTPAGYIFISDSLIKNSNDEDELASIISKELGHLIYKHKINMIDKELKNKVFNLFLKIINECKTTEDYPDVFINHISNLLVLFDLVFENLFKLHFNEYNNFQEIEAYSEALKMLIKAGYKPDKSIVNNIEKLYNNIINYEQDRAYVINLSSSQFLETLINFIDTFNFDKIIVSEERINRFKYVLNQLSE